MDTNRGRFVEEESAEAWMQRISVGEIIKIHGEECEVTEIAGRTVTLKLLSAEERMERERLAFQSLADMRESMLSK